MADVTRIGVLHIADATPYRRHRNGQSAKTNRRSQDGSDVIVLARRCGRAYPRAPVGLVALSLFANNNSKREAFDLLPKTFDKVWYKAFLLKLPPYELLKKLYKFIGNFLTGHSIKVATGGICSDLTSVTAGVPRGCILNPSLFNLHINDLLKISKVDQSVVDALSWGTLLFLGTVSMTVKPKLYLK
ncbi:RNA-directed DNA polymerase from mobile element jockey [Eumeta japonica]|uniref:RNA-directed DNA polymerase from mobile element jockey n=1 Tax=Eumeta variegata TaxID=151549 RepID=A0A4C1VHU6_EUMVA|nr:RNA-directed DNA polymerase from mobile element jockey [Eumeta japonica]